MAEFITYRQYDSRWGGRNYNKSSSMSSAGCGPTSCATILYGLNKKITPINTMKYMQQHGYAIPNNGTAWNGIPACLKHFGAQDVQKVESMSKVWQLMSKGYVGVFLFRAGNRNGKVYTTSGHYIPVTNYKTSNGKHYVYLRDTGARHNDGWHCYETQMKGLIPQIWLCKLGEAKQYSEYELYCLKVDGDWGRKTTITTQHIFKLKEDGNMGKNTWKAIQKKVGAKVDGIAGKETYTKMSKFLKINKQTKKTKTLVKAWQKWCNTQVK